MRLVVVALLVGAWRRGDFGARDDKEQLSPVVLAHADEASGGASARGAATGAHGPAVHEAAHEAAQGPGPGALNWSHHAAGPDGPAAHEASHEAARNASQLATGTDGSLQQRAPEPPLARGVVHAAGAAGLEPSLGGAPAAGPPAALASIAVSPRGATVSQVELSALPAPLGPARLTDGFHSARDHQYAQAPLHAAPRRPADPLETGGHGPRFARHERVLAKAGGGLAGGGAQVWCDAVVLHVLAGTYKVRLKQDCPGLTDADTARTGSEVELAEADLSKRGAIAQSEPVYGWPEGWQWHQQAFAILVTAVLALGTLFFLAAGVQRLAKPALPEGDKGVEASLAYGKLLRGEHKDCLRLDYKPGACPWPDAKWQLDLLLDRVSALPPGHEVDDNDEAVGCGDTIGLLGCELVMDAAACEALPPQLRTGLLKLGGKSLAGAVRFSVSVFKAEWLRAALKVETPDGPVNLHFMESMQNFPLGDREAVEAFCYWKAYGIWAYFWYPFSVVQFRRMATWTTQKLTAERNLGVFGKDYFSCGAFQCGDNAKGSAVTAIKMRLRPRQEQQKPAEEGHQGFRSQLVETAQHAGAGFDLMFQFATDPMLHPINDLTVAWDEEYAPWVKVGEVRIPKQPCRDATATGAVGSPLGPLGSKDLLFEPRANLLHVAIGDVNAFRNYCYRHYDCRRQEHLLGRAGGRPATCPFLDILKYCQGHAHAHSPAPVHHSTHENVSRAKHEAMERLEKKHAAEHAAHEAHEVHEAHAHSPAPVHHSTHENVSRAKHEAMERLEKKHAAEHAAHEGQ